jgi:hypothetical protein
MSNPASVTNISKVKFKTSKTVMAQASEDATPFFIPVVAYDTDAEQQRLNPLSFSMDDLLDSGVENIIVPFAYNIDIENQIQQLGWYLDVEEDREGVPYIIIPTQAYDTDAFNQLQQAEWIKDYEDLDIYQFIAPVQLYVLSIYKISTEATVECVVEVLPTVTVFDVVASNTCSASVKVMPSTNIYDVVCQPTVKFSSITVIA